MGTLTIHYEGYWQCRQATDPDPSDDWRGASGYTFALGHETDLDQVIRLQKDEIPPVDFRSGPPAFYPPGHPTNRFGVFVKAVTFEGVPFEPANAALHRGQVRWKPYGRHDLDPATGRIPGPRFELRNTITFFPVTNGIFMPIIPFELEITNNSGLIIGRDDPLDPEVPRRPIWEMGDVKEYAGRCPVEFTIASDEVMAAVGAPLTSDFNTFFEQRKEWLQLQLVTVTDPVEREALENRLYQLANNNRFEDRLGLKAQWDFPLRGHAVTLTGQEQLGGVIVREGDWRVRFWMGGFDGDLMRGYLRGTLAVPFTPGG